MDEGKPPPSSAATPAAGPRKRKSGSDADAAAAADDPKPTAWRDGFVVDDEPPWGKRRATFMEEGQRPPSSAAPAAGPKKRKSGSDADDAAAAAAAAEPKPTAWRDSLRIVDEESPWGHKWRQGDDAGKGFSPRKKWQGTGGSGEEEECWLPRKRPRKATASRVSDEEEEERWLPRKGGRHISGEPQDISLPTKRVRLHTDETQDTSLPRTRRHPGHDLEESEDKLMTLVSQDTSVSCSYRFVFGSRSEREGKVWQCVCCKATNTPRHKLVFSLPEFHCGCGRKFLQDNNLDFCLADVRVNFELIVSKIFEQEGPHCIANALCQAMLMMHNMDCITEDKDVKEAMMNINPWQLIDAYHAKYQLMDKGNQSGIQPSSVHKFIKMALMLKNRGIELEDGTFFRIGDISFIAKDNHEAICEELANGVPLLAVITPGVNFEFLQYCQVYCPPLLRHFHECNNHHKQQEPLMQHEAHMVVLVGPAFKANGQNPSRAYYFANSHARWCERKVKDNDHESVPGINKPVEYGIGKIKEEGLVYSVIKLWKFGDTAGPGSVTLEDEDEEAHTYENKISNKQKFTGEYMAHSNP